MVERTSPTPSLSPARPERSPHAAAEPSEAALATDIRPPASGQLVRQPDPPRGAAQGVYHQRSISGDGPSALVGVRLQQVESAERSFRSEGAARFAKLLRDVDRPGSGRVAAANIALDTLLNYIDGRTDRANQVGSLHSDIASAPPQERVPLLRRSIHVLRRAVRDGVLPSHNAADLKRLSRVSQGMGWNFDFDDNIASMDTKIVVFERETNRERSLSTTEFAEVREQIGKSGEFANYEIRNEDGPSNSFRNFRDADDPGVFWRDLSRAMDSSQWKGPSWAAFQRAMSSPETARWSTIITARGHYPNTIHAALRRLVDQGYLENVPPRENIFPVSLPGLASGFGGGAASPSAAKVVVMEKYLDRLQAAPFGPSAQPVIPPDGGRGRRFMHLWGFSDDDFGTFKKTVSELGDQVRQGRWPDVKITVFFTGIGHPEADPHAVVIASDGSTRPRLPAEAREVDRALEQIAKLQQTTP